MQKATVKQVRFPKGKRIIVISDIHGHLQNFRNLLKKVTFSKEDILVIDGDVLEKGPQSLATLRYIMQLAKEYTVYQVLGNNDWLWDEPETEDKQANEELLGYMLSRNSIFRDMCTELGIKVSEKTDVLAMKRAIKTAFREEWNYLRELPDILEVSEKTDVLAMKRAIKTAFREEWNYLRELPDILESEHYIFVHAGLESEDLQQQEKMNCVKNDWFFSREIFFSRWCIVGHFPVCLYDQEKIDCTVRIDRARKIISIDGGCVVKNSGQLNALIIPEDGSEEFIWEYVDDLPKAVAVQAQKPSEKAHSIHWPNNEVKILTKEGELSLCKEEKSGTEMWIPNSMLTEWEGKMYTDETTDYQPEINVGDEVSVVAETSRGTLVKRKGLLGWYTGTLQEYAEDREKE